MIRIQFQNLLEFGHENLSKKPFRRSSRLFSIFQILITKLLHNKTKSSRLKLTAFFSNGAPLFEKFMRKPAQVFQSTKKCYTRKANMYSNKIFVYLFSFWIIKTWEAAEKEENNSQSNWPNLLRGAVAVKNLRRKKNFLHHYDFLLVTIVQCVETKL